MWGEKEKKDGRGDGLLDSVSTAKSGNRKKKKREKEKRYFQDGFVSSIARDVDQVEGNCKLET